MICPFCAEDNDKVIDSRACDGGSAIRRRRECVSCTRRFTTYERIEKTARLAVVKKDGTRSPFDIQKILAGVQAACGKRPIPEEIKVRLAQQVEEEIHRKYEREVPSSALGELVADKLRETDHIAYIRFASEYHDFRTLEEFARELNQLRERTKNLPNQHDLFPNS